MPAEDPFEAFKKKKELDQARKQSETSEVPLERPIQGVRGGIKGLTTHRYETPSTGPLTPPKGMEPTRLGDGPKGGSAPGPKPKGFEPTRLTDPG
ncbi:MAG: hypothetical protein AB7F75_06120 [Planctomycetota bacterium]